MENDKKYFEKKFKDFESAAPLGVWNKIESGLDKKAGKRKTIIFMRIAAGLALLITAAWITWSSFNQETKKLAQDEDSSKVEKTEKKQSPEKQQLAAIDSENQKKLIQPQKVEISEKDIRAVEQKTEVKNDNAPERSNKVQSTQKEEVKGLKNDSQDNSDKNNESPKIDLIESRPLLAGNEIDSIQPLETELNEELLAQVETEKKTETEIQKESSSKSITIILRPKSNDEVLASNDEPDEEKGTYEKFKETINKDLYKYKIRLGEVPDLALNKLKLKSN